MVTKAKDIEQETKYALLAANAFKEVIQAHGNNKIDFVVGGGLALHILQQSISPTKVEHFERMTRDVDIDVSVELAVIKEIFTVKLLPKSPIETKFGAKFQWKHTTDGKGETLSMTFFQNNKNTPALNPDLAADLTVNFDICPSSEQRLRSYFTERNGFFKHRIEKAGLPVPPAHLLYLMKFQAVAARTAPPTRDICDLLFLLRHSSYFDPALKAALEPYRAANSSWCQEYFKGFLKSDDTGSLVFGHARDMYYVLVNPTNKGLYLAPKKFGEGETDEVITQLAKAIVEVYKSLVDLSKLPTLPTKDKERLVAAVMQMACKGWVPAPVSVQGLGNAEMPDSFPAEMPD
ncbi:hypothetical protein B0H16DRAFT_1468871 [Mycena metata]|uniref:Uncharacterized protein n=1 Tax=Mycena metata TaxID=1033252 RepID=A0AAD7HZU6_9AGAR|nr:hypothetical protein B0H16DRAFT_1468871 [Mycena metata]